MRDEKKEREEGKGMRDDQWTREGQAKVKQRQERNGSE